MRAGACACGVGFRISCPCGVRECVRMCTRMCMCVCVCVCVRARAIVCVILCVIVVSDFGVQAQYEMMFTGAAAFNDSKTLQHLDTSLYDTPVKTSNQ